MFQATVTNISGVGVSSLLRFLLMVMQERKWSDQRLIDGACMCAGGGMEMAGLRYNMEQVFPRVADKVDGMILFMIIRRKYVI